MWESKYNHATQFTVRIIDIKIIIPTVVIIYTKFLQFITDLWENKYEIAIIGKVFMYITYINEAPFP
jgi:hypothetical protein